MLLDQKTFRKMLISSGGLLLIFVLFVAVNRQAQASQTANLIAEGKQIFRFDTFGDEDFCGGQLQLHQAIQGEQFGGVGPGVSPAEMGIDSFQADRSPDLMYRTAPLMGLWTHTTGGFYHDGRFATLLDVVNHYDTLFSLGLTDAEKADLVEYLKSLGE